MVDFRVDDGFPHHPKTLGMRPEVVGVWTLIGCWCARYLTDGYIPDDALRDITTKQLIITDLANRNLIARVADGWQMVDWMQYQRSKADVDNERERWRIRQQRARRKRDNPDPG